MGIQEILNTINISYMLIGHFFPYFKRKADQMREKEGLRKALHPIFLKIIDKRRGI